MILIQGIVFSVVMRASAFDLTDRITIGGALAAAYQYQMVSGTTDFEDTGRGAAVVQPEMHVALTEKDDVYVKFGFAAGNALNDGTSPFHIAPWAADLEDGVKNINGRNRNYLLTAWYKHTFALSPDNYLGISGGIIDAADYLDENAYAGDEDTYNYYGLQFGYLLNTILGEGNYRIIVDWTNREFEDPQGRKGQARKAMVLSFDQQLGDILGVWFRFGRQNDNAAIDYQNLYSGGLNILGKLWNCEKDNVGLAYAIMNGGNLSLDKSQVLEIYYRLVLNDYLAISADVQYLQDDLKDAKNPSGWILGTRLTVII